MMLLLIKNVFKHIVLMASAITKCTISFLPSEFAFYKFLRSQSHADDSQHNTQFASGSDTHLIGCILTKT